MVFFPPGTYLVSTTIPLPFGAQVIGDVLNRPLIIASSGFIGLGVLSTDKYTSGGTGTDGLDQEYVGSSLFERFSLPRHMLMIAIVCKYGQLLPADPQCHY